MEILTLRTSTARSVCEKRSRLGKITALLVAAGRRGGDFATGCAGLFIGGGMEDERARFDMPVHKCR